MIPRSPSTGRRTSFASWTAVLLVATAAPLAAASPQDAFRESWRWVRFGEEDGLPSDVVLDVIETGEGVWALTDRGLAHFDGWRWEPEPLDPSWGEPLEVSVSSCGNLWLRTTRALLLRSAGGFVEADLPAGVDPTHLVGFAHVGRDRHAALVRHGDTAELFLFGGDEETRTLELDGSQGGLRLVRDGSRSWLAGSGGVQELSADGLRPWLSFGDEPGIATFVSGNDAGERLAGVNIPLGMRGLWGSDGGPPAYLPQEGADIPFVGAVGPDGTAVVVYDTNEVWARMAGRWSEVEPAPLALADASRLLFRPNGDLWAATRRGLHLFRASSRRWTAWRRADDASGYDRVFELALHDGLLWASSAGGVETWTPDGRHEAKEPFPEGLGREVTALAADGGGTMWAGSGHSFLGVLRWTGDGWERVARTVEGEAIGHVHKIRRGSDGRLWLLELSSTQPQGYNRDGSVQVVVDGEVRSWTPAHDLGPRRYYDFGETRDGSKWFASHLGLERWKDGTWSHFDIGETSSRVFRLVPDGGDGLFVAKQEEGLYHFHPRTGARPIPLGPGEGANNVWDVALDPEGRLWVTTLAGLFSVAQDGTVSFFERAAGLASPRLWPVLALSDRVHVGALGGGVLTLDRSEESTPPPRVLAEVNGISRDAVRVAWTASSYWGELPRDEVETRFRVDGGPWAAWSLLRRVNIDGLSAGEHAVEIQAKGLFGRVGAGSGRVAFEVEPPLLLRPGFLVPVSVLATALIALYVAFVTRRERDARALRRSEVEHRALMEDAFDGILIFDEHWTCLAANQSARSLLGARADAPIGRRLDALLPPGSGPEAPLGLAVGDSTVFEREVVSSDGDLRVVEAAVKRLPDGRVQAILRDLTSRRRLESEKRAFERELTETQRLESLGLLAGGVAHDFNNLLMVIGGNAEQALRHADMPDVVVRDLENIRMTVERAAELTEKLLAYAGHGPRPFEVLNLSELVRDTLDLIASSIGPSLQASFRPRLDPAWVQGDAAQLRQVVVNLVVNAAEALGEQGHIDLDVVRSDTSPGTILLSVRDDGPGMPPATLARVFEPFFTTKFKGRGLGLAAVRGIVAAHGGAIDVASRPGAGTRFDIRLSEAVGAPPMGEPGTAASPPARMSGLVLVVDDDEAVLGVTCAMLEGLGFEVLSARSGEEGIELFRGHASSIRCALVDLTMPGCSGVEVVERLQQIDPDVRLLLMSGHAAEVVDTLRAWGEETGFLKKPFSWEQLAQRVEATLSRSRRGARDQRSPAT